MSPSADSPWSFERLESLLHWRPQVLESLLRQALERDQTPAGIDPAGAELVLAWTLLHQRRLAECRAQIRASLNNGNPHREVFLWLEVLVTFYEGRPWPAGWDGMPLRWRFTRHYPMVPPEKQWDGSPLSGKTFVFAGEGGLGDHLLFIRYVSLIRAAGAGEIIVAADPRLIALLRTAYDLQFVEGPRGTSVRDLPPDLRYDTGLNLLDAPRLFGTTRATCPPAPTFHLPAAYLETARRRIADSSKPGDLCVGICWRAGMSIRSVPPELFAPLARVSNIKLFALMEPAVFEATALPFPVENLGADDILATAAAVQTLDAVVSVDTMLAHLAGSLHRPSWILNNFLEAWLWGIENERSPWYPSVRALRRGPDGWEPVMQRVCEELAAIAASPDRAAALADW